MSIEDNNRSRKVPPASDEHRPVSGKKDTKRWCRGKAGVEHVKEWVLDRRWGNRPGRTGWYNFQCTSCGRQFEWCTDYLGTRDRCKCGHHGVNKQK